MTKGWLLIWYGIKCFLIWLKFCVLIQLFLPLLIFVKFVVSSTNIVFFPFHSHSRSPRRNRRDERSPRDSRSPRRSPSKGRDRSPSPNGSRSPAPRERNGSDYSMSPRRPDSRSPSDRVRREISPAANGRSPSPGVNDNGNHRTSPWICFWDGFSPYVC